MKTGLIVTGAVAAAALAVFGFYMVDIDQTQEAMLPDVNVEIEEGQLPAFDADVGTITAGTTEAEVTVPKVEVTTEEASVTLPTLSIEPPEADSPSDS